MTDLDAEARAAVDALIFRLRNRGDAGDERFAREFITALEERGWRPPLTPPTEAGEDGTREAARELLAFACATRPDWGEDETWAAVHAARTAGLGWDKLALRLMGIALREEDPPTRPRELWDYARGITTRQQDQAPPAGPVAGALAALKAGDYAAAWSATHEGAVPPQIARVTGGQPVLTDDNDDRRAS